MVERSIKTTTNSNSGAVRNKYPWREMQPGDWFFVPHRTEKSFRGTIQFAQQSTGYRLSIRTVNGGICVRRVDGLDDRPTAE